MGTGASFVRLAGGRFALGPKIERALWFCAKWWFGGAPMSLASPLLSANHEAATRHNDDARDASTLLHPTGLAPPAAAARPFAQPAALVVRWNRCFVQSNMRR